MVVEQATCNKTGMFACSGPAFLMYVVGVPVTYVVWSLALRVVRAPLPWLAPLAVLAAMLVLAPMTEAFEPPKWVWPAVMGALTGVWARFLQHDARQQRRLRRAPSVSGGQWVARPHGRPMPLVS